MRALALFLLLSPDWTVYLRRAGPIRIGMPLAEVRQILRDPKARLDGIDAESVNECAYLRSKALPQSFGLMFAKGRVVRIDVHEPGIRTASGAGVGDTEEKIKQTYTGRIDVQPHKYTDGHYLNYTPSDASDKSYGMVFETDRGKVTEFRTGTKEAVALVEGCS